MFRLSVENAQKAGIPTEEVEKQVGEIIRLVPYHLQHKAIDSMYKEVKGVSRRGTGGKAGRAPRGL
jgi:hypothetical protein